MTGRQTIVSTLVPVLWRGLVSSSLIAVLGMTAAPASAYLMADQTTADRSSEESSPALSQFNLQHIQPVGEPSGNGPSLELQLPYVSGLGSKELPSGVNLKFGQLYLDFHSLSVSLLHSDNIYYTLDNRQSGSLTVVRLGMSAYLPVTENLILGVGGSLDYLPDIGKFGIGGFGLRDPLYNYTRGLVFHAQLRDEFNAGLWDMQLSDDLSATGGVPVAGNLGFDFGSTEERVGRYYFRDSTSGGYPQIQRFTPPMRVNTVALSGVRPLPTDLLLTVGFGHSDYTPLGPTTGNFTTQLPHTVDRAFVGLESVRETLRFKPYADYRGNSYNLGPWNHQVEAGVSGPLTDNTTLKAGGGYYWTRDTNRSGTLWTVDLLNHPDSLTDQRLSYNRSINDFLRDVEQTLSYRIEHDLNSAVKVGGEAYSTRFDLLDRFDTSGREDGINVGAQMKVLPHGGINLQGGVMHGEYRLYSEPSHLDAWLGRVTVTYDTLQLDVLYRHDFPSVGGIRFPYPYQENFVLVTLSKSL